MTLAIGDTAPDFSLLDQEEKLHQLSAARGRWVLLYFYPKDMTPGCIKEACAMRDSFPKFRQIDAEVLGISADSVKTSARSIPAAERTGPFGEPNRVFLLAAERPPGAHTATIHPRARGTGHSRRPASRKSQKICEAFQVTISALG